MIFCQNRGVISQQRSCPSCAEDMTWKDTNTNTYADGYMWNCRGCRISQSVRNNSILSNSRLSFKDFTKLLASWANRHNTGRAMAEYCGLSERTISTWRMKLLSAPQPRQPRSRVVRSRKSSFTDYLPLIRKYEAVLQKQKDDPHSTLTDLCSGIVSYNSFKEIRPIAELYIADPGTFREIYSRLKHGPVKSLKLLMKDCRDVLSTIDLA